MLPILAFFTTGPSQSQKDFYQAIADFIHQMKEFFGTGLQNLDAVPEIFQNISEWLHMTFSFIPQYFVVIFTWFIIAAMIVKFLRW